MFDPTKTTFSKIAQQNILTEINFHPPSSCETQKGKSRALALFCSPAPIRVKNMSTAFQRGWSFSHTYIYIYDSISLLMVIAVSTGKNPFCDCYISYRVHVYFCPSLPTLKSLFKPALLKFLGKGGHPVESPPSEFKSVYANFQYFYFLI